MWSVVLVVLVVLAVLIVDLLALVVPVSEMVIGKVNGPVSVLENVKGRLVNAQGYAQV